MAEYRDSYQAFRDAGAEVIAISADDRARSKAVVSDLGLPYPLLCDPRRAAISAWGLLNTAEKGGIADPGCFLVDRDRKVRYRCIEDVGCRVSASEMASYVRAIAGNLPPKEPAQKQLRPGLMFLRAKANAIFRGVRVPIS